jgi:tetratricopeptide (TPR) repeat protein
MKEEKTRRHPKEQVLLAATYCAIGYECSWEMFRVRPGNWKGLAIRQFKRAMQIVPESAVPYYCLGNASIDFGERDEAYRYFRKAADMGSQDAILSLKQMTNAGK